MTEYINYKAVKRGVNSTVGTKGKLQASDGFIKELDSVVSKTIKDAVDKAIKSNKSRLEPKHLYAEVPVKKDIPEIEPVAVVEKEDASLLL